MEKQPEVVKEDALSFQYYVKFASCVAPAPIPTMLIHWNSAGKTVVSFTVNQPDIVTYSYIITAEPEFVPSYGFTVNFSRPFNRTDYATNAPTFTYLSYTTSYTVLC